MHPPIIIFTLNKAEINSFIVNSWHGMQITKLNMRVWAQMMEERKGDPKFGNFRTCAMKQIIIAVFALRCVIWKLVWNFLISFHLLKASFFFFKASLYSAIMYFYNVFFIIFFHFPNQKFISRSILSVWLWPVGAGWGSPQSSKAGKWAPLLHDPPTLHCWWVAGGKHPILGEDFLFTFSWRYSAGWPCTPHLVSSISPSPTF